MSLSKACSGHTMANYMSPFPPSSFDRLLNLRKSKFAWGVIRTIMTNLRNPRFNLFLVSLLVTLVQIQTKVRCYQYKVGDLDSWGIPISPSSQLYDKWSKYHYLSIGDSLRKFFLHIHSSFFPFLMEKCQFY